MVTPSSEVAAGGNYNLRYLSADARRYLVQDLHRAEPPSQAPAHAIIPRVPVTIYMPRAGFLWSNTQVWNDEGGFFEPHHEQLEAAAQAAGNITQFNLGFADPFALRHPWVFEQVFDVDYTGDRARMSDSATAYIRPNDMVYLRSAVNDRYLSLAYSSLSIVDTEARLGLPEEGTKAFSRYRIGYVQSLS